MPFLFHQFLLNKILSTTNTPKNYAVWNISWLSNSLVQLHLKNKKEIDDFLPFKQRIKEKIMELTVTAITIAVAKKKTSTVVT